MKILKAIKINSFSKTGLVTWWSSLFNYLAQNGHSKLSDCSDTWIVCYFIFCCIESFYSKAAFIYQVEEFQQCTLSTSVNKFVVISFSPKVIESRDFIDFKDSLLKINKCTLIVPNPNRRWSHQSGKSNTKYKHDIINPSVEIEVAYLGGWRTEIDSWKTFTAEC